MRRINKNKGFTLVEMMVSLCIFAVVAVIAIGALVRVVSANKKAQNLQAAMTNIDYALETMTRELRTGTNFHCETATSKAVVVAADSSTNIPSINGKSLQSCPINNVAVGNAGLATIIAFNSSRTAIDVSSGDTCNLITAYTFSNNGTAINLQKAEQGACYANLDMTVADAYSDVISNTNVTLTDYRFGVGPVDSGNTSNFESGHPYPYVFMRLIGYAGVKEKERSYFDIQSTVSSRSVQI